MHVVFRHDTDVVSKNPAGGVNPTRVARWVRRQGVLSFGYLFFARAKKSSSLPKGGRKPLILLMPLSCLSVMEKKGNSQGKSLTIKLSLLLRRSESLFFACAKKSNQKKAEPGRDPAGCAGRFPALLG